jgi:GNAT superfamily N-acetyltransferase
MGRIVGDGAMNFDIVDVAVDPAHQGKGLGRLVMEKLVAWLDANAFDGLRYAGGGCSGAVREVWL